MMEKTFERYVSSGAMNAVEELIGPALSKGLAQQTALIGDAKSLTYGELDLLVSQYSDALRKAGVVRENRVLFMLNDSPDFVAAYLGAMHMGAVSIAFNVRSAAKDLLFVIEDSNCSMLVIDAAYLPVYLQIADRIKRPLKVVVDGDYEGDLPMLGSIVESGVTGSPALKVSPDDMAFWVYTSGTTGTPKAAVHLHHDVIIADLHMRENLGVEPGDRIFSTSKLFFAYALGHSLLGGLRSCATIILTKQWPDATAISEIIHRHQPDLVFSVPTLYRNLLRDGVAGTGPFKSVRVYVSAGEKLPVKLFEQWWLATGRPILEGIGTSETLFLYVANSIKQFRSGSCGKPVPWAEIKLMDESEQAISTTDTPGQLWVRMPSVADRYWNRQDQSRKSFHGHWYKTGDMFRVDEAGWWYHLGRGDEMLKISGQWVSPAEIEACALTVPGVEAAAVIGYSNEDSLVRSALFVVPRQWGADDPTFTDKIRQTLVQTLSIYKCPRVIRLVDEIPCTASGKMQKYKLRELLREEAGGGEQSACQAKA
ncbi:benzoate-CoA ligase family protein [Sedimenticola sp.]|uniref:benzoate-CoA ligase family protein n=1 Tax=Sedimenticola sp. TaxID=1940285 RepID=UPI002589D95F|nr:benzoate-CoA ligase family protein [Sedimenticola sp.]MCW8903217.1 benzoate-CoA ligase family protein [Sedimenticola sp.]